MISINKLIPKALLVSMVVYLSSPFLSSLIPLVQAGTLTTSKLTIADSRAGKTGVTHTFNMTTATTGTIKTVEFKYCDAASGTCNTPTGLVTTGATLSSITGLSAGTASVTTNGTITFSVTSAASITSGTALTAAVSGVTNPTATDASFFVRITTRTADPTDIDSTTVAAAILDTTSITVSASVDPTFTFTITAINTGNVNSAAINSTTTTATSIPFGLLAVGTPKIAAHDLTVTTNAANGYTVTVAGTDPPLVDGSNNIDKFTGTDAAPTAWSAPAGDTKNVNTGFFGYTTQSTTLCSGTADRFSSNKWAGAELGSSVSEVACSAGAVSSDVTRVGWQVEVNGVQPSGSYSGVVTLVATPTY